MGKFDTIGFISRAVSAILKDDPGGIKNMDQFLMRLNRGFEVARRRAVEQDLRNLGGRVQSVGGLFAPGTREMQAGEMRGEAVADVYAQDAAMRSQRRAQAEQIAVAQLPIAYQEATKPSFLEKLAGATIGGAIGAFLPPLANKLFPNVFQTPQLPAQPAQPAGGGTQTMDDWWNQYFKPKPPPGIV